MLLLVLLKSSQIGYAYPNREQLQDTISYLPQQIMQMVGLGLLLCYFFILPKAISQLRITSPILIVFIGSIMITTVLSPYLMLSLRYLLASLVLILPIILYLKVYGKYALYRFFEAFLLSVLLISIIYSVILPHYAVMGGNHAGAFRGIFMHKNGFGSFCVLTSLFCLAGLVSTKVKMVKAAYFVTYLLCFVFTIKSHSTTALVLFFLMSGAFIFFSIISSIANSSTRCFTYYFFIVILFVIVVLFSAYYEDIAYALGKDPTLTGRTELWEVLFYIAMERPLFGYGIGVFTRAEVMYEYAIQFGWEAKSTHNSYLNLLLGGGLVSLITFLTFIIKIILNFPVKRGHPPLLVLSISGIIFSLIHSFSESSAILTMDYIWVYFILFIILSFPDSNHNKS